VEEEVERYMTRWRKSGIESTSRTATRIATGLGPINADSKPCGSVQDILSDVEAGIPLRVATRIRGTCINDQALSNLIASHRAGFLSQSSFRASGLRRQLTTLQPHPHDLASS